MNDNTTSLSTNTGLSTNKSNITQIGLFYGSSTCYTEMSAEKICALIAKKIGKDNIDLFNIATAPIEHIENYQYLIFGIPTWDYGELQEDWDTIWDKLGELNLSGRHFAIFGQGDQLGYPQWFLDAMGFLHHLLINAEAIPCGYWPNQGYQFEASKALINNDQYFVGLALDDENQFAESEQRISLWCQQILNEFKNSAP